MAPIFVAILDTYFVTTLVATYPTQALRPDATPDLFDFKIEHVSGINVQIGGLGPLNWVAGGLTTLVVNNLRGALANAFNEPIKNIIKNELKKVKIPF